MNDVRAILNTIIRVMFVKQPETKASNVIHYKMEYQPTGELDFHKALHKNLPLKVALSIGDPEEIHLYLYPIDHDAIFQFYIPYLSADYEVTEESLQYTQITDNFNSLIAKIHLPKLSYHTSCTWEIENDYCHLTGEMDLNTSWYNSSFFNNVKDIINPSCIKLNEIFDMAGYNHPLYFINHIDQLTSYIGPLSSDDNLGGWRI